MTHKREEETANEKAYRIAHREEKNVKQRAYNAAHRKEISARHKVYLAAHREEEHDRQRKRRFNLSREEFVNMLKSQSGRCAICRKELIGYNEPVVDHDHKTGKVRGLLCLTCNNAAGLLFDNYQLALEMADYLKLNAMEGK